MQPIADQRGQPGHGHQHHQCMRRGHAGDAIQRERQHDHAEGEHQVAGDVEAGAVFGVVVGHDFHGRDVPDDADGQVDQEHPVPGGDLDQPATEGGADERADEGGNGDETHGAEEFFARHRAHHGQAADGQQHGAADALQHACGDELVQGLGEGAGERAEGEQDDGDQEGAPGAEAVGDPAGGGDEGGHRQGVAEDHRLHLQGAFAETAGHRGEGGVDDGGVQHLHENRQRYQPQQGPDRGVAAGRHRAHLHQRGAHDRRCRVRVRSRGDYRPVRQSRGVDACRATTDVDPRHAWMLSRRSTPCVDAFRVDAGRPGATRSHPWGGSTRGAGWPDPRTISAGSADARRRPARRRGPGSCPGTCRGRG
ncbi:hypothetical protein D3C71_1233860 [compost metagenome]